MLLSSTGKRETDKYGIEGGIYHGETVGLRLGNDLVSEKSRLRMDRIVSLVNEGKRIMPQKGSSMCELLI